MSEPFLAEIRMVGFNFAPKGWAFCDGQLLPIANNTALFSLIGTTYGGDGRTTTALPNLQGCAPMHPGRGPGLSARRLGEKAGSETIRLSETQIPSHEHTLKGSHSPATPGDPGNTSVLSRSSRDQAYQSNTTANLSDMASQSISSFGGSQAHNNLQPYLTLNFIIALVGTYPSRS